MPLECSARDAADSEIESLMVDEGQPIRKLTMRPEDARYRKRWMDAYIAAGGSYGTRRPTRRAGSATVDCIYSPTGLAILIVRVVSAENDAPFENANVWIEDPDGSEIILRTNADGIVTVEDTVPGEYAIEARLDDHHRFGVSETIAAEQTTIVEIKLQLLPYLTFDGSRLCWMNGDGSVDQCWSSVSGRPGHQNASEQSVVDRGPLPEGNWNVRQTELQAIGSRGTLESIVAELGRTAWPGGESAWGHFRIWLHPRPGTNTFGRSGFSIHGGDDPGSAGCIDMTSSIDSFVRKFRSHGRDLILQVDYP